MTILNNDTLMQLERNISNYRENPKATPFGYPVSLVADLLETVQHQKKLKKSYQRSAASKAQCLVEIFSTISREIDKQHTETTHEVIES